MEDGVQEEGVEVKEEEAEKEEEDGERREAPNKGNPVCRFWRRQQRDWAIAAAFLKRGTHLAGLKKIFTMLVCFSLFVTLSGSQNRPLEI